MIIKKRNLLATFLGVIVALLSGCMGSTLIRQNFTDYSQTLHYNGQQQMLQNIVYLRYRETPFFMKVGALSVNYELKASSALGIKDIKDANSPVDFSVEPSIIEKPTVTYTPVEGDIFVKQMLTEIDPNVFALLIRSGWPIDTLSKLAIVSIGDLRSKADDNSGFRRLVQQLAEAQIHHQLNINYNKDNKDLVMTAGELRIPLNSIRFRSFLDVMYELSKNVEVPEKHQNWVRNKDDANGLIHIYPSLFKPGDGYVSISNHGYYFSIKQDDVDSKDVFSLMQVLYQMQAGDIKGVQPVLTLPIN